MCILLKLGVPVPECVFAHTVSGLGNTERPQLVPPTLCTKLYHIQTITDVFIMTYTHVGINWMTYQPHTFCKNTKSYCYHAVCQSMSERVHTSSQVYCNLFTPANVCIVKCSILFEKVCFACEGLSVWLLH